MNTKKNIQLLLFLIVTTVAAGQQLYLETGKTVSSFDYKNSQGEALDNLQSTNYTFMAMGYKNKLFTEGVKLSLGLSYAGYGAIGSDDVVGNIMKWDVNYLEIGVGLDFKICDIKKAEIFLKGQSSVGFLMQGAQTLNNQIINLKNNDDFNKVMTNFKYGAGFSHPVSNNLSFYVQYLIGKSLNQGGDDDNESLRIKNKNISFGVLINLAPNNTY